MIRLIGLTAKATVDLSVFNLLLGTLQHEHLLQLSCPVRFLVSQQEEDRVPEAKLSWALSFLLWLFV